jgi:hypothetical protein
MKATWHPHLNSARGDLWVIIGQEPSVVSKFNGLHVARSLHSFFSKLRYISIDSSQVMVKCFPKALNCNLFVPVN